MRSNDNAATAVTFNLTWTYSARNRGTARVFVRRDLQTTQEPLLFGAVFVLREGCGWRDRVLAILRDPDLQVGNASDRGLRSREQGTA